MKPRTVTRMSLASPIFWAMFAAYVAGVLLGGADVPPWWVGSLVAFICAALTNAIERWYITARAKVIVTQGIVDALEMRPDLFVVCPEHGDGCSATCRRRRSREFGGQSVTDSTVTGSVTQVRDHRGNLNL